MPSLTRRSCMAALAGVVAGSVSVTEAASAPQAPLLAEGLPSPPPWFLGEWQADRTYWPGDLISVDGAVYVAVNQQSVIPPGDDPANWERIYPCRT